MVKPKPDIFGLGRVKYLIYPDPLATLVRERYWFMKDLYCIFFPIFSIGLHVILLSILAICGLSLGNFEDEILLKK